MPKNRPDLTDDEKAKRLAALAKSKESPEDEPEEEEEDDQSDEESDGEESGSTDDADGGESGTEDSSTAEDDAAGSSDEGSEDDKPEALSPEEERRQRKRQEKKERRERARAAREADQNLIRSLTDQLNEVKKQVTGLAKNSHQSTIAGFDDAIKKEENAFQLATQKMARAVKAGDDAAFAAALTARDESRDRWLQLKQNRGRLENLERQSGRPSMPKQIVLDQARKFADEHKWYDVQGRNEDSQVVLTLDQALTNAGFSPETPQYWDELRKRVKKYLPHRFSGADGKAGGGQVKPKIKGKPGSFGSGMRSGSPGSKGVVLSKARQDAILALGIERGTPEWNDMVRTYQQYDKAQPASNRR